MRAITPLVLPLLLMSSLAVAAEAHPACRGNGDSLQQLRIYEIDRGNSGDFHARFRDHALRIMARHGFHVTDIWESDRGDTLELVYLLSWPDRATMDAAWEGFLADAEWVDIKRRIRPESGVLVREVTGRPLVRLSYSPACD